VHRPSTRKNFDYSQNAVNLYFFYYFRVPKLSAREAILSNVVQTLRDERIRKKLSMNALAKRSGLHVSMISLVEREMRNPTLDALLRLSEALEIDLWRAIKRATEKANSKSQ
jgi:ribosome-binding protein aMBF1 (putative translation factor)